MQPGTKLAHYEIVSPLGKGGMGEVWRARDSKLGREVAIKTLPEEFAKDADRLARFEREAKLLASLNHPNIAAIYGLEESNGTRFLVLELVEGDTLADQVKGGAIPVEESLKLALQIAEALEAAHEKGVIHRDLKPANVKVTPEGKVKVLDFGLAKAFSADDTETNLANSPTLSMQATQQGLILGTAAYMSPEQAQGQEVDKRTDIWAFGCVLYEMLIGRAVFAADNISLTLARVLERQPDYSALPANLHPKVIELLERCLQKEVSERWQAAGDLRLDIKNLLSDRNPVFVEPVQVVAAPRSNIPWIAAAVFVVLLSGLAWVHFTEESPSMPSYQFQLGAPSGGLSGSTVISPNGLNVAFVARNPEGLDQVWIRSLETGAARALDGTEGAQRTALFWSPDSQSIGFATQQRLMQVQLAGAPPLTLAELSDDSGETGRVLGGAWNGDGVMVIGSRTGLFKLADAGVTLSRLTRGPPGSFLELEGYPSFLPDGRRFLYFRNTNDGEQSGIYVGSIDSEPEDQSEERILASQSAAWFVADPQIDSATTGHLLFERDGLLLASGFDTDTLALEPERLLVADEIASGSLGALPWVDAGHRYSASTTGALAYRTGVSGSGIHQLIWFDREGNQVGAVGEPDAYGGIDLSRDGDRVATFIRPSTGEINVWLGDLGRNVFTRVNPTVEAIEMSAVAGGRWIALTRTSIGSPGDIYGSVLGENTLELWVEGPLTKHANDISDDDRFLIYDEHQPGGDEDLWVVVIAENGEAGEPIPFLTTPANESFGQFSPDNQWIAYHSTDSGRREVFLRRFMPDEEPMFSTRRWQVSTQGGIRPRWRADGRELYYVSPDRGIMAVSVGNNSDSEPELGTPDGLFTVPGMSDNFRPYDVSPDGRFLVEMVVESEDLGLTDITVVTNWIRSLEP